MNLAKALDIAYYAHKGQKRFNGEPFIFHPIRVMQKFEEESLQIIALLHDVIEDSDITAEHLEQAGFSRPIVEAIYCLTHYNNISYNDYIDNISKNFLARLIKIQDLKDNLKAYSLTTIKEKDIHRIEKHHKALRKLLRKES